MERPYIKTIIEPINGGFYVWAEVLGTKVDGYWVRLHYREYAPEMSMCTRAAESLKAKLLNSFGISGVEWDGEIRWGTRDADES